jgi:hypothetical protein
MKGLQWLCCMKIWDKLSGYHLHYCCCLQYFHLPSSRALVPPTISVCQLSAFLPLSIHRLHMDIPVIHNTSAVCPPPTVHAPCTVYLISTHGPLHLWCRLKISEIILLDHDTLKWIKHIYIFHKCWIWMDCEFKFEVDLHPMFPPSAQGLLQLQFWFKILKIIYLIITYLQMNEIYLYTPHILRWMNC